MDDSRAARSGCWPRRAGLAGCPGRTTGARVRRRAAESVGESRSRVAIARAGLPTPVLQWEVRDGDGHLVGRADFGWPDQRTVGEFDGRGQVRPPAAARPGAGRRVYAEKLREDAIRATDLGGGPLDLGRARRRSPPVAARIRDALPHLTPRTQQLGSSHRS